MTSTALKQRRKALAAAATTGHTRYRARQDLPVAVMTQWAAPYTGGYDRVLPAGEVIRVANAPRGEATMVYADPENYRGLHAAFVPRSDRWRFWSYRGYCLCIRTRDLDQHCERLRDEEA